MNKNYLAIVVVLVIVAATGFFLFQNKSGKLKTQNSMEITPEETVSGDNAEENTGIPAGNQVTGANNPEPAAVVNYEESGFEPKTITVQVNSVIQWMNNTDNEMWVASAVHPSHQNYPGFDQLKGVGKGEVYRFTFTRVGSWKYHNHLNPSDTGTIEITP